MVDTYDLEDPLIRDMIRSHHWPREIFTGERAAYGNRLTDITCNACWASWPCAVRRGLRAWQANNGVPIE